MSAPLTEARIQQHREWISAWTERLAYCLNCAAEYTDAEAVYVDEIEVCPDCRQDDGKRYYYCKEHGSPDDDCER